MIYSTNQNKQFYVATDKNEALTTVGQFKVTKSDDEVFVTVMGANGPLRTDIIKKDQILSSNLTDVKDIVAPTCETKYTIVDEEELKNLTEEELDEFNKKLTKDLLIKVVVREAYANDSNSKACFYVTIDDFDQNTGSLKANHPVNRYAVINFGNNNQIVLLPKAQDWKRGLSGGEAFYDVTLEFPGLTGVTSEKKTLSTESELKMAKKLGAVLNSAHALADLELFCYSEKAVWTKFENPYAGIGAPELIIDPKADYSDYKIQTVSYYFVNPNGHRSVKEIQFLVKDEITEIPLTVKKKVED